MQTNYEGLPAGSRRKHLRRGRGAGLVVTTLSALTFTVVLACAPPAQNQVATPGTTPSPTPTPPAAPPQSVSVEGDIRITAFTHASLQLEHGGKVIHVDPTGEGDVTQALPADLILVTDIHTDHLDPAAIQRLRKSGSPGTPVVGPEAVRRRFSGTTVIANGQSLSVAGLAIEAVPMYNKPRGRNQVYHTRGRGNGYVLTLGARRVYIAGDTECTEEMKNLRNIDIAFVPMNLPYTMNPVDAAGCVKAFKPKVVYPYHYRDRPGVFQNRETFKAALAGEPVEVRLLDWYRPRP